jgi:regulator of cell morphogenesis and NO signaling
MTDLSISHYYEVDHDRLDDLFKNFQNLKHSEFLRAKEFFVAFKFGLQRHIIWEEEILFPFFEEKTGIHSGGPTEVMRREHRQIGEHLEAIHKKVQAADPNSDEEEKMLLAALSVHNMKEENILYPAIDRAANASDMETIFKDMKNVKEERYSECCH